MKAETIGEICLQGTVVVEGLALRLTSREVPINTDRKVCLGDRLGCPHIYGAIQEKGTEPNLQGDEDIEN